MTPTRKSGISLLDLTEHRPGPDFTEDDITTMSNGLNGLHGLTDLALGGDVIATWNGVECFRRTYSAGRHEIRGTDLVASELTAQNTGEALLVLTIVENGVESFRRCYRLVTNYTAAYSQYQARKYTRGRQRDLRQTLIGRTELTQALNIVLAQSSATRCYVGLAVPVNALSNVTRGFLALEQFAPVTAEQVLAEFFTSEAAAVAQTLPNEYWFARCALAALSLTSGPLQPINLEQLQGAMATLAEQIDSKIALVMTSASGTSSRDRLQLELAVALGVAEGKVLLSVTDGAAKLLSNPIFDGR